MGIVGNVGEIICRSIGHRVDRRRVWHDDRDYRTTCLNCRKPLIRGRGWNMTDIASETPLDRKPLLRDRSAWRLFDSASDASIDRKPHPQSEISKKDRASAVKQRMDRILRTVNPKLKKLRKSMDFRSFFNGGRGKD